jgi:hypothetical protein
MKFPTLLMLGCGATLLAACHLLRDGPSAADVDAAVRRALEAENHGGLNALFGQPLPMSADVISAKPDGDCERPANARTPATSWSRGAIPITRRRART